MNIRNDDEMCCTVCGSTEGILEYHMAGYDVNDESYSNLPISGGIDYPVEYIWCTNCDRETDIELFENWQERTTNED